ncbi:Palmitoyltransferase pfa5 [Knufia fluminis]|uniref:Palmitoyltransferase n=1 Tax=Knufia fluminis TaxID=191047 RepID=A0AAN8IN92_9EURO|nr:Palmitoyltransferase pfa5 [Knufia fluminis]
MPKRTEANRKTNIGVARAVPVFLLGIIGYASWVFTKLICVDYLISPPASILARPQRGSAIIILVIYYILLVVLLISFGRLLDTVVRRPGLIPHGPQWYVEQSRQKSKHGRRSRSTSRSEGEKSKGADLTDAKMPKEMRYLASESLPFKVEEFWLRDVFVCNPDGRPPFCSTCYNWKPDRSHHCSEVNRCVLKLDHFCPWVGGVVSETSFKFFIQFIFYGALFTLHLLVVTAYFFAQRRQESNFLNAHWIVLLALAGLFFLFSGGMCMSSCQFAFINSSTIENLDRKTKVWSLAVYTSPRVLEEAREKNIELRLISYPRPPDEQLHMLQQPGASDISGAEAQAPSSSTATRSYRTFAILETEPGANPFDIGPLANFQEIMGMTIWEWLSPIKPSPCLKHDDSTSLYKLGPVVDELKANTGLETWSSHTSQRSRRRKSRVRSESTAQSDRHA